MSDQFTSVQWNQNLPLDDDKDNDSTKSNDLLSNSNLDSSKNDNIIDNNPIINDSISITKQSPKIIANVINPEMQTDGSNCFTIYHIHIKTDDNSLSDNLEYEIERRYSDFDTLHKGLTYNYPTLLIPPLPNKQRLEYIKGGRFTDEFVLKRCNSLDLFINRILNHKILKNSPIFLNFLSSKLNVWNNCRLEISSNVISDSNISTSKIEGFTEFLMNSFKKPHVISPNDSDFKELIINKNKLQENLHKIDKIYSKILSKQGTIANELNSFSDEFSKLTVLLNNDLNGKYRSENELNDNDKTLVSVFKEFSNNLKENSNEYIELNKFIEFNYLNNLKDLEHYLLSVDSLLKVKDNKILDYEMLNKYLEKTKQEKEHLQHGGKLTATTEGTISYLSKKLELLTGKQNISHNDESLVNERIEKLQNRIELLQKEKELSRQILDKFESDLLNEWTNFQKIKNNEIIDSLNHLSQSYLKFYENSFHQWDNFQIDSAFIKEYESKLNTESDVLPYLKDQQVDKNQEEIEDLMRQLST